MTRSIGLALLAALLVGVVAAGTPAHATPAWRAEGEAVTYDRRTVWQAINGAAGLYLGYGLKQLIVQTHARGDLRAEVQRYVLGSPLDALGVYRRERPAGAKDLSAGDEAASVAPRQCLARRGASYVRDRAARGRLDHATCKELLLEVTRALPGGAVPELSLLPARGRLPRSLRFSRKSCFGLAELRGCLRGTYKTKKGAPYQLFAVVLEDRAAAKALWARLAKRWKPAGRCALARKVPYKGMVLVIRTSRGIFGAASLPTRAAALAATRKLG